MRYFDENTKKEILNPNFDLGKVSEEKENHCVATYTITTPATYKEVVVQEYPNGGKDVEIVVDTPEIGSWGWTTESVYGVPEDTPEIVVTKQEQQDYFEKVSLWHTYTQAELDEIAKQKALQDEKSKVAQEQQKAINNMVTAGGAEAAIDHDAATRETYNALPKNVTNALGSTLPFSKAFARGVERAELTIDECPTELKAEIEAYEATRPLCATSAHAHNGTITGQGSTIKYKRGTQVALTLTPNQGYRVPTVDEMPSVTTFTARDTEDKNIPDFRTNYVAYNNGIYTITIPENCASIYGCIYCISDNSDKLPKVNRKEHAAPTEKKKATKKRK